MSLKYHPDKNPGDEEASARYKDISRAYEVLYDENLRQIYDTQGEEGVRQVELGGDNRKRGPNANADIEVTLKDLFFGTEKEFTLNRNVYCPVCRGSGAKGGETKKCPTCKGQGVVYKNVQMGIGMSMKMQTVCDKCGGKKVVNKENCSHCRGKRVVGDSKTVKLDVERGMASGDTIVLEREGEQVPDMIPGDVVFTIKQKKDKNFSRVGDNLYTNREISLKEALLGFQTEIKHVGGHFVTVKSD
jgi:DnaJ-class molecular chaperone